MRVFIKAAAKLQEIVQKKRLAASTIRNQVLPVRSGAWLVGSEFSRHHRVRSLPEPLGSAKQPGGWPSSRYYAPLMQIASWISLPWFSWSPVKPHGIAADVVLISKSHEPVGFDLARQLVIRRGSEAEVAMRSTRYAKLQQTYHCASFSFNRDSDLIMEPLVQGCGLAACLPADRAACIAHIFEQLTAAPAVAIPRSLLGRWQGLADQTRLLLALPVELDGDVSRGVGMLIGSAKRCWIHGDLSGDNIVVHDGAFTVIDLDTVAAGPAFADIVTLAFAEARMRRSDFLDHLLTGAYDNMLGALGCEIPSNGSNATYTAIFVAWLAWCRSSGDFPEADLERFIALWVHHRPAVGDCRHR